jgi:sec-independent protein translocase protein TatA
MIPGFPQLGGLELLILLAVILLFFGAKRLPQLGRSLGRGIRELREGLAGAGNDKDEVQEHETDEEKPSLNEAARDEIVRSKEDESNTRAGQKSP